MTAPVPVVDIYNDEEFGVVVGSLDELHWLLSRTIVGSPAMLHALGVGQHALAEYPAPPFVDGFYDGESNRIGVRGMHASFETVTHELGHALLSSHFQAISETEEVDRKAAALALSEGDPALLALSIQADTRRKRAILACEEFAAGHDSVTEDGDPPSVSQEEMLGRLLAFPYLVGAQFCDFLVRAGGLSLLDAAHLHPPETTEQVLHAEKYLAGELAVPVDTPECPGPSIWVSSGHLGELMIQTILLTGNRRSVAARAAEGWGGDAFTLSLDDDQLELRLVTTWDTDEDALEFEHAIHRTSQRWDAATRETSHFDGPAGIVRSGRSVVVVRGAGRHIERFDEGDDGRLEPSLTTALFAMVGGRLPPRPPLRKPTSESPAQQKVTTSIAGLSAHQASR